MKLTSKQYLVDITVKTIEVKQTKHSSKISCQVHYGDNFLKMKLQPFIKNGTANFMEERITIPYSSDIALVFKMLKNDKKETFLGHYALQVEKYLKDKNFFIEIKRENLQQNDAKITFDCRIIDKALFNSDSEQMEAQIDTPWRKDTDLSIQQPKFYRKPLSIKPHSEYNMKNRAFLFSKKREDLSFLLNDEFSAQLSSINEIISKKQHFESRNMILAKYERDEDGFLRSEKIIQLQNKLINLRDQERMTNFLIYSLIAGAAFVLGFLSA